MEEKPKKDEKNGYFQIHVHSGNYEKKDEIKIKPTEDNKESPGPLDPELEKRSVKSVFKDALRQIVASAIILAVGVVILNWSAYSKITKNEWGKFWGTKEESPLIQLVEADGTSDQDTVLKSSTDPEIQKRQIPELNLEVTPSDNRLVIPRIDQNIPIVRVSSENLITRDWNALEDEMQDALKNGVVHYPGTSVPGETGNIAITGHSSYFPWDPGRFKDVFALLHDVVVGDKIVVYWDQKKFIYEIDEIKVVLPEDIEVLKQTPGETLTLITCTPVGTNLKRLVVRAVPLDSKVLR